MHHWCQGVGRAWTHRALPHNTWAQKKGCVTGFLCGDEQLERWAREAEQRDKQVAAEVAQCSFRPATCNRRTGPLLHPLRAYRDFVTTSA